MLRSLLPAACLVIAAACPAGAATVNFILDLTGPGGTFNVYATTSAGDNVGLSLYGVELTGPGIDLKHLSTATMYAETTPADSGSAGFTVLRGVDELGDDRVAIRGSQDIFSGQAHLLYGLGQEAGSLSHNGLTTSGSVTSASWGAEFLLAGGTYAGDSAGIDIDLTGVTCANVFTTPGQIFNEIAAITKEVRRRDPLTGAIVSTGPISLPPPPAYEPVAPILPPVTPPPTAVPSPPAIEPEPPTPPVEPPLAPEPPADPLPGEGPSSSPLILTIDSIDFRPIRNWIDFWHPGDPGNLSEILVWPRWGMEDGVVDLRELLINPIAIDGSAIELTSTNDVFDGSVLRAYDATIYDGANASELHTQSLLHVAAPQAAAVTAPGIPEPSTFAPGVLAALALAGSRRRRRT